MTKEEIFRDVAHQMAGDHLEEYQLDLMVSHGLDPEHADAEAYLKGFDDGMAKGMLLIQEGTVSIRCIEKELKK